MGGRDAQLLGAERVRHHRWPGRTVADAIARPGTYRPAGPMFSREDALLLANLGIWEGEEFTNGAAAQTSGGYSAHEQSFSVNAWHPVQLVKEGIGVPPSEFDRLRRDVRRSYGGLDPVRKHDPTLIYGGEIEAVRRAWVKERQLLIRTPRRRRAAR